RPVAVEQTAHHAGAAGVGQELAVIADHAARRHVEHQPGLGAARGLHLDQLAATLAELVDDDAGIAFIDVDHHFLARLLALAGRGVGAIEHARPADRELEALAPHGLDQHTQLQLAATGDLEGVLVAGLGDAEGDIALGLAHQARANHPAGDLVAFA